MARQASTSELHSGDLPLRTLPPIADRDDAAGEAIVQTEAMPSKDYADELAFMEEPVTVVLHKGRDTWAPRYERFGVDGKPIWVEVGKPTVVKRKYVEVMARSQPMTVATASGEEDSDALTFNKIHRRLSANFSFSIVEDKNPRGHAWLAKVMREN